MKNITDSFISARRAGDIAAKQGGSLGKDDFLLIAADAWITDAANEGNREVAFDQDFINFNDENFEWFADFLIAYRYDVHVNLTFRNGAYRSFDWGYARKNPEIIEDVSVEDVEISEIIVSWN